MSWKKDLKELGEFLDAYEKWYNKQLERGNNATTNGVDDPPPPPPVRPGLETPPPPPNP